MHCIRRIFQTACLVAGPLLPATALCAASEAAPSEIERIDKVIRSHSGDIDRCLGKDRNERVSAARVTVQWTFAPSGRVTTAKVLDSTIRSAAAHDCLLAAVKLWTFGKSRANRSVEVIYPLGGDTRHRSVNEPVIIRTQP
jgi:hypothetical protein